MTVLLEIEDLSVSFNVGRGGRIDAVRHLDLSLDRGQSLSLIGESGSGKTVIASAVLRSLEGNASVSGDVRFDGESVYGMSEKRLNEVRGPGICSISQNASQAFDPLMRIGKQIEEFLVKTGVPKEHVHERADDALSRCGFEDSRAIMREYPHRLSGGMAQRAMIAMCIAADPELLIADEPTKGLDGRSVKAVTDIMTDIGKKKALLMITHDLSTATCCGRTAVLYGGVIVEDGPSSSVKDDPLHPYTKALQAADPRNGMHPIGGSSLRYSPEGCPFGSRCGMFRPGCDKVSELHAKGERCVRCPYV